MRCAPKIGQRGFQILESQLTLVVVQLLGAFAMQDLVQLGDQMLQPPVGFLQRVPFTQATARAAARWLSGMADRSMDGAADMKSSYPDPTVVERFYCIQVILQRLALGSPEAGSAASRGRQKAPRTAFGSRSWPRPGWPAR